VIATMFAPGLCRRSSATWTILATMVSLLVWLAVPSARLGLPHPIYATWLASLVAFGLVALADRRPIARPSPPLAATPAGSGTPA
jgi:SSS family solute:Na+ symporter